MLLSGLFKCAMHSVAMAMVVETCAVSSLLSGYCVGGYSKFMAMVVMGDTCVQSIMAIHTIIRLLCW